MKRITFLLLFGLLTVTASAQFLQRDSLASDQDFRSRVKVAMLEAASEILANPADSVKFKFAGRIILEPNSAYFTDMFTRAVLTNPVINGASSDSDLKFTVNTQFGKLDLAWRRERNELVEGEQ